MKSSDEKLEHRMVRTFVAFTHEQHAALRALSEQTRVPVATIVRDAVAAMLRSSGARWVAK